jgi:anti-sigma regulatory factor (Ser/Thr protein kinase)
VHLTSGGIGTVSASSGGAPDAASIEHDSGVGPAFQNWLHASLLELAARRTDVSCGRLHARNVLWEWKLAHLASDAELLVSELLSNAVKATWSADKTGLVVMRLFADAQRLLIEVWDNASGDPQPRQPGCEAETGRGFMVVQAISHRWGYHRASATLKVVWAELLITTDPDGEVR